MPTLLPDLNPAERLADNEELDKEEDEVFEAGAKGAREEILSEDDSASDEAGEGEDGDASDSYAGDAQSSRYTASGSGYGSSDYDD